MILNECVMNWSKVGTSLTQDQINSHLTPRLDPIDSEPNSKLDIAFDKVNSKNVVPNQRLERMKVKFMHI